MTSDEIWNSLYQKEQNISDWVKMVIDNQSLFWEEAKNPAYDSGRSDFSMAYWVDLLKPKLLAIKCIDFPGSGFFPVVTNNLHYPHTGSDNGGVYLGWEGEFSWSVASETPDSVDLISGLGDLTHLRIGSKLFNSSVVFTDRRRAYISSGGYTDYRNVNQYYNVYDKKTMHVVSYTHKLRLFADIGLG